LIAASDKKDTKNPKKTQTIRKLLEQEGAKITLLWVPSHVEIPGNEEADDVAKESLDDNLEKTEKYPPQDLANWMAQQLEEQQQRKWEQTDSEMRNRKQHKTRRNETSEMTRRDQVAGSRLRTGYSRATHAHIINQEPTPEYPFCYTKLTTDHILWTCKDTEPERIRMNITSEVWKGV
jgi:hypothetical protein